MSLAVPESEMFSYALATAGPVARVTLSGEIDVAGVPRLAAAMRLAEALAGGMILDLSGVEFIDCGGAQLLLETARRVRARDDLFMLDGASDVVERLLRLIGIEDEVGPALPVARPARPDLRLVVTTAQAPGSGRRASPLRGRAR